MAFFWLHKMDFEQEEKLRRDFSISRTRHHMIKMNLIHHFHSQLTWPNSSQQPSRRLDQEIHLLQTTPGEWIPN